MKQFNAVLCRYDEIALKGGNRMRFENQLITNIKKVLTPHLKLQLMRVRGRILFKFEEPSETTVLTAIAKLEKVFGLASFSPGHLIDKSLGDNRKNSASSF